MKKLRARTGEEKDFRRKKLLEAAKPLFSMHGYQGTRISMITKAADLSPAAFYLYFKGKTDIYRQLSLEGTKILSGMIKAALADETGKYGDRIAALASAYFNFFLKFREYYDIIAVHHLGQNDFFANLDLVPELEAQSRDLLDIVSSVIRDGIAAGEFRPVDPWETAVLLWGMMDGVLLMAVRQTTSYTGLDIHTLVRAFFSNCMIMLSA